MTALAHETKIDFQTNTPEGVQFVVHGVPARIRHSPDGQEFRTFSMAVSLRLDELIKDVLTRDTTPRMVELEF
jgi:hypothetical protein